MTLAIVVTRTKIDSNASHTEGIAAAPAVTDERTRSEYRLDGLTGLGGHDVLRHAYSTISETPSAPVIALLLCDLDHFKAVNDRLGHQVGDELLVSVAALLQNQATGSAAVARLGGDEFGVLAVMSETQGRAFAEFLQHEIRGMGGEFGPVTVSFGVATSRRSADWQSLVAAADSALYAAKTAGRDRVITESDYENAINATDRDELIVDFENRVRTYADRMLEGMLHRANELTRSLRETAERDTLTGLYNREHLSRVFSREFDKARAKDRPLSIVLIDLDDFGQFNKTKGFVTGDRVLAGAALAISSAVRATDWTARYGGEEFIVVMPDTDESDARSVADRVVGALRSAELKAHDGASLQVTGTAGVAELSSRDTCTDDLVDRASDSVIRGKRSGKNQVV
jgi:diguanylate cyclase (GGDEF)-like protein